MKNDHDLHVPRQIDDLLDWVVQAESPPRPTTRACYKDLRHSCPNHPTRSQPAKAAI